MKINTIIKIIRSIFIICFVVLNSLTAASASVLNNSISADKTINILYYNANTSDIVQNMPMNTAFLSGGDMTVCPSSIPKRNGYTFKGWYKENECLNECKPGFTYGPICEDVTLYAKWDKGTSQNTLFNVVYKKNTSDIVTNMPNELEYEYGKMAIVNPASTPSRDGYIFAGWFYDIACTEQCQVNSMYGPMYNDLILYAKWNPLTPRLLSYDKNTTDDVTNMPHDVQFCAGYNVEINPDNMPMREGYRFNGWYYTPECTDTPVDYAIYGPVNENIILYAKWSDELSCTLTYDQNTSDIVNDLPSTSEFNYASYAFVNPSKEPTRNGFVFAGWYWNKDCEGSPVIQGTGYGPLYNNAILYAKWEKRSYAITDEPDAYIDNAKPASTVFLIKYNLNGGSGDNNSQIKQQNETVYVHEAPIKPGNTFNSWMSTSGKTYAAGAAYNLNEETTMTAQWNPIVYSITYDLNGGVGVSSTQQKQYNTDISLHTAPQKQGFIFTGWKSSAGTIFKANSSYIANASTHMVAQWENSSYTIKYELNEGEGVSASQIKEHNKAVYLHQEPQRLGYIFTGWRSTEGNFYNTGDAYTANKNTTMIAQWSPVVYSVKYDLNGGAGNFDTQIKQQDIPLTLYGEPIRDGFVFTGWKNESGTIYPAFEMYTANLAATMTAQWTPQYYTITYSANGGIAETIPSALTKGYNEAVTLDSSMPSHSNGFTFQEWNTKPNGTGISYQPGALFTNNSNITLYAIWNDGSTIRELFFEPNTENVNGLPATQATNIDESIIISPIIPTHSTLIFDSWNTSPNGTGTKYNPGDTITISKNTALYAQWRTVVTVTYHLNEGTYNGYINEIEIPVELNTKVELIKPLRQGYTFAGWYLEAVMTNNLDYCGCFIGDGYEHITITEGVDLYAYWIADEPIISDVFIHSIQNEIYKRPLIKGTDFCASAVIVNNGSIDFKGIQTLALTLTVTDGTNRKTYSDNVVVLPRFNKNIVYFIVKDITEAWGDNITFEWNIVMPKGYIDSDTLNNSDTYSCHAQQLTNFFDFENTNFETQIPNTFNKNALSDKFPLSMSGNIINAQNTFSWDQWAWNEQLQKFEKITHTTEAASGHFSLVPQTGGYSKETTHGNYVTRSGYQIITNAQLNCSSSGFVTKRVFATLLLPEYNYSNDHCIVDQKTLNSTSNVAFNFGGTKYYTPMWLPDGNHIVLCHFSGSWTPIGEMDYLIQNENTLEINGSLWDDYYNTHYGTSSTHNSNN